MSMFLPLIRKEGQTIQDVYDSWKDCTSCPYRRKSKKVTIGVGNLSNPEVMVIGQYPSEIELDSGIPFQGQAGLQIRTFIAKSGVPLASVYFTNFNKCPPIGTSVVSAACLRACAPYLDDEIVTLSPKLVIAMGTSALSSLGIKAKSIQDIRGAVFEYMGTHVIVVNNPLSINYAKTDEEKAEKLKDQNLDLEFIYNTYNKIAAPVSTYIKPTLQEAFSLAASCTKCDLSKTCTNKVFGVGDTKSPIMFIGMGPGRDEDKQGLPFIGPAGKELDRAMKAAGTDRKSVYICNTLKCRPIDPGTAKDRNPTKEEMSHCWEHLERQLLAVEPKVVMLMGSTTIEHILGYTGKIGDVQGKQFPFMFKDKKIIAIPAWHPSFLIRNRQNDKLFNDLVNSIKLTLEIAANAN